MGGYTENRILIYRDYNHVFDLTNKIDLWPQLFTEYQSAEILESKSNEILFKLTTYAQGERPSRTWVSKRVLNKERYFATATRIDPTFPFEFMNIKWEYEPLPSDNAVLMTWIQIFNVHRDCKFTNAEMESFLNENSREQMLSIKHKVEKWATPL